MSLSPRPLRPTRMIASLGSVGASLATCAMACEGFEGGDDALSAAEELEAFKRLRVGHAGVLRALDVLEVAVLRADPGVVEAGRDAVGLDNLSVLVLEGGRTCCRGGRQPRLQPGLRRGVRSRHRRRPPRRLLAAPPRRLRSRRTGRWRCCRHRRRRPRSRGVFRHPRSSAAAPPVRWPPGSRGPSQGTGAGRRRCR